jgi:DNA-binding NarL/FixJ family response regulator
MLTLGVKGYILKSTGIDEVEAAIKTVMNGECYFSKLLTKMKIPANESNIFGSNEAEYQAPIAWW